MATRKTPSFERKGYHHGNLKEALVDAARKLIAERGPAGFTLAEAARLAGVSAAAPYRHFKDRSALIAEVAQRGFAAFAQRLAAVWGKTAKPIESFGRMGEAYLAFAREEPGYYGAMFARGGSQPAPPSRKAGAPAFAVLENAIAQVAARGLPAGTSNLDARRLAYQVWAMAHGVATLSAGGLLPPGEAALTPERLLQDAVPALIAQGNGGPRPKASTAKVGSKTARR